MIAAVSADHYIQPLSMGNRQVLMLFTAPSVRETLPACLPAQLLLVCGHPYAGAPAAMCC